MATERYTERIGVRASPEEARIIERRAEKSGLSKSRFLAEAGASAASTSELEKLHYQLKRGADRLGEIAQEAREGEAGTGDLEATIEQIDQAAQKVLEAL